MDLSLTNCEIRTENGRTLNTNDDTSGTILISGTTLVGFTPVYMHSRNMDVTIDNSWIKSYNAYSGSVNDTTVLQILGCSNANMSVGTGVEFGFNNTITVTNSFLEAETFAGEIAAIATDTYGAKNNTIRLEDCEIMTSGTLTEEKGGGELTPLYASSDASNTLVIKGLTYGSTTIAEELYMDMSVVPADYTQVVLLDLIPAAKIGSTAYGTLEDAVAAAADGDTVTLLDDVVLDSDLQLGTGTVGFDLNLNGYTVDGGTDYQVYTAGSGTINIYGGTIKNNMSTANASGAALYIYNGSQVTLENVSITGNYVAVSNYGSLTVKSANLTGTTFGVGAFGSSTTVFGAENADNSGIVVYAGEQAIATAAAYSDETSAVTVYGGTYTTAGAAWDDCPIYWAGHGTLNVIDGTFTTTSKANSCGIYVKNGTVNISGGTFDSRDGVKIGVEATDTTSVNVNISGGVFNGVRSGIYAKSTTAGSNCTEYKINVSGGTFTGTQKGAEYLSFAGMAAELVYTGGTFNSAISELYIADGYELTDNGDGTYTVAAAVTYVAQIGDNKYETLADAVTAAQAGDTVTLLCDYTDPHPANTYYAYDLTGKTLDLNGFTFTSVNTGCSFEGTGGMIRNGKMVCADGGSYALFIGDMGTTESFIVDGVEMTGGINVFNASGVVLRNLTVAGTKYYAVWLDENAFATVESGTYTAGNVALFSGCKATADDGSVVVSTLTVTDGTFVTNDKPVFGGAGGAFSVSGGTFDKDDAKTYVVSGYYLKDNGNGTYTVIESPATIVDTAANMTTEVTLDGLASNSAIDHEAGATYKVVVSTAPAEDIAAANEKISASNDTNTNKAIFDISVIKTDSEGASTDISGAIVNQQVTLTLEETPAQDSTVHVYHVKGDTVEEIKPVTVSGNTVTFTAPSFSTYAVTFSTGAETIRFGSALTIVNQPTVEYNGGTYSPVDIYFGIDTLQYKEVGVEYRLVVTGDNATETSGTKSTTVVYSAMNVTTTAGEQKTYTPADLNASYMYGQRFLFDTTKYTSDVVTLYVKPYAVSLDGTETYYGEEITLSEDVCAANGTHLFADAQ